MTRFVLGLAILVSCNPAFAQNAPTITVRNVTLVNLTQVSVEDYQQIIQSATEPFKFDCEKSSCVGNLDNALRAPDVIPIRVHEALQERGYYRAEVGRPEVTLVSESPTEKIVDVAVRVNAGSVYKLGLLILAGNRAFPADELRAQLPFKPGEVFNTAKVRLGLDNLRKFYADQGYINFTPVPDTQIVDERQAITLKITLDEGKRFYFGDLNLTSLALQPEAAQAMAADWSSVKGRLYSGTELEGFMKQHSEYLPSGFQPKRNLEIRQDEKSKTVTVDIVP